MSKARNSPEVLANDMSPTSAHEALANLNGCTPSRWGTHASGVARPRATLWNVRKYCGSILLSVTPTGESTDRQTRGRVLPICETVTRTLKCTCYQDC